MIDVIMPQMGESIVEGTLTKWLKKPGESVERDEPLFEISTDKVDTEIPSPVAGTLGEILVQEGATVGINTIVGSINDGGAVAAAPVAAVAAPAAAAPAVVEEAGPLSPLVRKMAREHNVDLSQVKGTGAGGRITKQDLEAYAAAQSLPTAPPPAPAAAPPAAAPPPAVAPLPPAGQARTRVEPMSTMRIKIAAHMVMSKRTSAH